MKRCWATTRGNAPRQGFGQATCVAPVDEAFHPPGLRGVFYLSVSFTFSTIAAWHRASLSTASSRAPGNPMVSYGGYRVCWRCFVFAIPQQPRPGRYLFWRHSQQRGDRGHTGRLGAAFSILPASLRFWPSLIHDNSLFSCRFFYATPMMRPWILWHSACVPGTGSPYHAGDYPFDLPRRANP